MADSVQRFDLQIPEPDLDALRKRLDLTRWPDAETAEGWLQGVPLERAKRLVQY